MWGGQTEFEYAWIFAEEDELLIFKDYDTHKFTESGHTIIQENILKRMLGFLELQLPTYYFALHAGKFDWEKWRVKCEEPKI